VARSVHGADPTIGVRGARRPHPVLAKALPSVTMVEIDGVGHMAPVTHPDRVNAVIASYLEGVTATG
jgi:pimeloyl-ACP methyl ester carboxylesterase